MRLNYTNGLSNENGSLPLDYQWYTSDELLPSKTQSTLHLVTTIMLYLNTIINPLIYAMSASSMRNRILIRISKYIIQCISTTYKVKSKNP